MAKVTDEQSDTEGEVWEGPKQRNSCPREAGVGRQKGKGSIPLPLPGMTRKPSGGYPQRQIQEQ